MAADNVLERLDWAYQPTCDMVSVCNGGRCGAQASTTAYVHGRKPMSCGDVFLFLCTPCLKELIRNTHGMTCPICGLSGVAGFLRGANPIPVVAP